MRFKAKLVPEQLNILHQVIGLLARVAGSTNNGTMNNNNKQNNNSDAIGWKTGSILYLDKDHLRLSTNKSNCGADDLCCFAELTARGGIFLEHRIESAAENNVILMELDFGQLRMALSSCCSSDNSSNNNSNNNNELTILKLAKRNNIPCLCVDATNNGVQVHHSIPIRVLRATEMTAYLPPPIADNSHMMQLTLPKDRLSLRQVASQIVDLSPTVYLQATNKGELIVQVERDGASIRTYFPPSQQVPPEATQTTSTTDKETITLKVDTKKLLSSLQWQQHGGLTSSGLLCLVENEMLVVHANLHPQSVGFLTYYVPVQYLPLDPTEE
jgi:HUS1 checkpoint protein